MAVADYIDFHGGKVWSSALGNNDRPISVDFKEGRLYAGYWLSFADARSLIAALQEQCDAYEAAFPSVSIAATEAV